MATRIEFGNCGKALWGGPYVIVDTNSVNLGACSRALWGGPGIGYEQTGAEYSPNEMYSTTIVDSPVVVVAGAGGFFFANG